MPFYEYEAVDLKKGCKYCKKVFEEMQSIKSDPLEVCPKCGSPVRRIVSMPGGMVVKGRQANQYNDIKAAKYWRDKDGVRHRVTPGDGSSKSATISKQTKSPEQVAAYKRKDNEVQKRQRQKESYERQVNRKK